MPLVSIIIPTRNRSALLREAIESVLAVQRDNFEIEVIVVDDGSTDDTSAVAQAYSVTYLCTEEQGASAARNVGMYAAQGDFIGFLDDDDVWLPNNIAPQLNAFAAHPEFGAVIAQVWLTRADRVPYGEPIPPAPLRSGWIFDELLTYWPQLGSVVVRTSVVREIGDFDSALHAEEEWDWILRIARRYPIGRVNEPVVLFLQRGYGNDALAWRRLTDTLKVFHRHTRDLGWHRRLRLQRVLWAHRGWYTAGFIQEARHYAWSGDSIRTLVCLSYALRTSPLHAIFMLTSLRRTGAIK